MVVSLLWVTLFHYLFNCYYVCSDLSFHNKSYDRGFLTCISFHDYSGNKAGQIAYHRVSNHKISVCLYELSYATVLHAWIHIIFHIIHIYKVLIRHDN